MISSEYFHNLKELAMQDLSLAHIQQHTTTASEFAELLGFPVNGIGAYSSYKVKDNLEIDNNIITGCKYWVSNIPNSDWAVFTIQKDSELSVIFVDLDNAKADMIQTLGMENTLTGHINFDHTPFLPICNTDHSEYDKIMFSHNLGFITNHYALAESLYNDIDQYTTTNNINCVYEKQKIKLDLSAMNLLWESAITEPNYNQIDQDTVSTLYSFSKKCLVNVTQFATEITGSGLYELSQPVHQRYRDTLIYSSHMRSLYWCLNGR